MLEAIAQTLHESRYRNEIDNDAIPPWDELGGGDSHHINAIAEAVAVLDLLQHPSQEMIDAGTETSRWFTMLDGEAHAVWTAMLAKALERKTVPVLAPKAPWRVFTTKTGLYIGVGDAHGGGILDYGFGVWGSEEERLSAARLIVVAVNSYFARLAGPPKQVTRSMRQAAETARNRSLAEDANDQIGALNAALNAAFAVFDGDGELQQPGAEDVQLPEAAVPKVIPGDIQMTAMSFVKKQQWYQSDAMDVAELLLQERERCAKIAKAATLYSGCPVEEIADEVADAVRGRSPEPDHPLPAGVVDEDDLTPF